MILIGYRKENDRNYFLLQNWWEKKQLVELDEEYLESCSPDLYYVKTPQTKIRYNYQINLDFKYAEYDGGKCDMYPYLS